MSVITGNNGIVNGLVLNLDAANPRSYTSGSTIWYDTSGNGNHGTLTNGPTYNSSNNGSIVFDGYDDYVDCGMSFNNLSTQLSINYSGRIIGNPVDGILVTKGEHNGTATANFGFQISPNKTLRFFAKPSGQSYVTIDSSVNIWDNNINYYTVTFNASTVIFYKNGNLFSSHTFGLNNLPSTVGPLYISGLKGYTSGYFTGNTYLTQIYNRALSQDEIQQNFNSTRFRYGI